MCVKLRVWLGVSVLVTLLGFSTLLAQTFIPTAFVAWSPDGTIIAVGIDDRVDIVAVDTMTVLNSVEIDSSPTGQRTAPAWSPDGTMLAIAVSADVQVWREAWSPTDAQLLTTFQYYALDNSEPSVSVSSIAWSPDGELIASAVGIGIDIWVAEDGTFVELVFEDWDRITDIEWFSDGRLAVANIDAFVSILDSETWEITNNYLAVASMDVIRPGAWAIAFSPDGDQMVIGSDNGIMQIWDNTRTTEILSGSPSLFLGNRVDTHTDMVLSLSWSSDGEYIASSGRDGTVRIYDAVTGEQVEVISLGNNIQANSVAWSPDGSQLAYGTADGIGVEIVPAPMNDEDEE